MAKLHRFHREGEGSPDIMSSREKLAKCLESHVVDKKPGFDGSSEQRSKIASSKVGAVDSAISRCYPPLEVEHLKLDGGKIVVMVGPNGSGKSTILDAILEQRNASFDEGASGYGKGVHGKDTIRISRLDQEEVLSSIQGLEVAEVLDLIVDHYKSEFPVVWEDPDKHDANLLNQEAEQRIDELVSKAIDLFEMDLFIDRKVDELSGGEKTKLSLLMLLASEPDVLLLDEPTNHLDLESIAKLTGLFETYKKAGVSIVCTSHVEWFLEKVGKDGTIELQMDKEGRQVISSKSPYKNFKKREHKEPIIKEPVVWRCGMPENSTSPFDASRSITIEDSPLKEVDMPAIYPGDIHVFSGKNGTGKTKLMNEMVYGSGKSGMERDKSANVAYLPQFWPKEVTDGTVEDFFRWVVGGTNPHSDATINQFARELRKMNFGNGIRTVERESLSTFSGGEQRLLWFIAASMIEGTNTLVLDEPSNHMDEATMGMVVQAIRDFPGTVVLSSHDLRLMEELQKDPGKTRQGKGLRNILFTREGDTTTIESIDESPLDYANDVIANSKKKAKRMKVA